MIKLFKKIFSSENIMKALMYSSLTREYITASEFNDLISTVRNLNSKSVNVTEEKEIKKAA